MSLTNANPSKRTVGSFLLLAVLLLASLGLQRFLVVCNGPHCNESIEFAHFASSCCEDEAAELEPEAPCCSACAGNHVELPHGDLDRLSDAGCGCNDVPLHCEDGPLPRAFDGFDPDHVCVSFEPAQFLLLTSLQTTALLPPPTGPPRTDRRSELVATTVLRL